MIYVVYHKLDTKCFILGEIYIDLSHHIQLRWFVWLVVWYIHLKMASQILNMGLNAWRMDTRWPSWFVHLQIDDAAS